MANADRKPRVLFLCTGNSCRSQMAEGWACALKSREIDAYSAGTHPHGLNPLAELVTVNRLSATTSPMSPSKMLRAWRR